MGKYVKYTDEQKEAADAVRISDILDREGEKYGKWGRQFQWLRHDSVVFSGSKWFRHSEGEGGRAIAFCRKFLNMGFTEAMEYLLDFCPSVMKADENATGLPLNEKGERNGVERLSKEQPKDKAEEVKALEIPKANSTMKCAYHYLIKERRVDPAVVSFFAKEGTIYEEASWHGVVFLGKDSEGKVRHAHVRGTQDNQAGKFRMTVEGSDSRYGFGYAGPGNVLYAFEAPIDLLSFLCLYPKDWKGNSYVALNGVSGNAIFQFLKEHDQVSCVVLCLDADEPGEKACQRLAEELTLAGIRDVRRLSSIHKDWNEDLVKKAGGLAKGGITCSPSQV